MVSLRPFRPDDAPVLLTLFRDTIRRVNSRDYNPDQIAAMQKQLPGGAPGLPTAPPPGAFNIPQNFPGLGGPKLPGLGGGFNPFSGKKK